MCKGISHMYANSATSISIKKTKLNTNAQDTITSLFNSYVNLFKVPENTQHWCIISMQAASNILMISVNYLRISLSIFFGKASECVNNSGFISLRFMVTMKYSVIFILFLWFYISYVLRIIGLFLQCIYINFAVHLRWVVILLFYWRFSFCFCLFLSLLLFKWVLPGVTCVETS